LLRKPPNEHGTFESTFDEVLVNSSPPKNSVLREWHFKFPAPERPKKRQISLTFSSVSGYVPQFSSQRLGIFPINRRQGRCWFVDMKLEEFDYAHPENPPRSGISPG
jgi:hypothetical protein